MESCSHDTLRNLRLVSRRFNALATPIAFSSIGHHTYTVFCCINAAILVSTFFVFPETAGRSLEEMSAIFEKASVYNPYDVVRIERKTPRRYDESGNLIDASERAEHGFAAGGAADDSHSSAGAHESQKKEREKEEKRRRKEEKRAKKAAAEAGDDAMEVDGEDEADKKEKKRKRKSEANGDADVSMVSCSFHGTGHKCLRYG